MDAMHKEKKLIEAKSVFLVKKCQKQSGILKQAKTLIDFLEEERERTEEE